MEKTPILTLLALALLTTPALAGGLSTSSRHGQPSIWLLQDKLMSTTLGAGFGADVDIQGDTAVVTAPGTEQAVVYERSALGWNQGAVLSTDAAGDDFGSSTAVGEDKVLVGARLADADAASLAGAVYIYEEDGSGDWTHNAKLTANDPDRADVFGASVDIDGGTVAVGAPAVDTESKENIGAVYLFQDTPTGWGQVAKLESPNPEDRDLLGSSVSVHGETVVAGTRAGEAHVFHHTGDGWTHSKTLTGDGQPSFGRAVDVRDSTLVSGAPWSSTVSVFEHAAGDWVERTHLSASDLSPVDTDADFGSSVSLASSGSQLLVGARSDDRTPPGSPGADLSIPCMGVMVTGTCERSGAAYLLEQDLQDRWQTQAKLVPPEGLPGDAFGASVTIDSAGTAALAGAPWADITEDDRSGGAYVFEATGLEAMEEEP